MTERVRVAYMAHAFGVGGAEEMALNLVQHLPQRFDPVVCCIHHAGSIADEMRAAGIQVDVLGLTPGVRRPWDLWGVRRYLRRTRPQIVHTFLMTASLYGRLAAILEHVPVVIGTEVNVYERKPRRHVLAERLLMAGTDRVVASAATVRQAYVVQLHADPSKVDVIYNAVDWQQIRQSIPRDEVRRSLGIAPDANVAGVVARLNEQKGHPFLFDALAGDARLADIELIVVGDGNDRPALEERARWLKIAGRVHFVGARRDLGNLLGAMDVFVLPSLWEGLPLSMVLAMGAGVPVVTTSVGGVPEVVEHGRTGLLVPPADAGSLADALARLFEDPKLRARLGEAGRASVVPRFGMERYVTSVVQLYDHLLAPHHQKHTGVAAAGA